MESGWVQASPRVLFLGPEGTGLAQTHTVEGGGILCQAASGAISAHVRLASSPT